MKASVLTLIVHPQKERDAKEARQLDLEIKRQQGREAKQQLFRRREQERRDQSRESTEGELICKDQQAAATAGPPPQQAPTDSGLPTRKHKLQIIQALRQESSTESETQSYTEFRG